MASSTRMEGRHIVEGELGCHVCQSHYPIVNGIADFGRRPRSGAAEARRDLADDSAAMRVAALLGLAEPGGVVILTGTLASLAHPMAMMVGDTQLLVINPAGPIGFGDTVSVLTTTAAIPLANGSCRGAAIDATHSEPAFLAEVTRVLKTGARLVAPASASLPDDVTELARDDRQWVGEARGTQSPLIPITISRQK